MQFGFVKVATYTPSIRVADVEFNTQNIIEGIEKAYKKGVEVLVLPELCLTGSTCGDLFYNDILLDNALLGLGKIANATKGKNILAFVGLPIKHNGKVYNVCGGISDGEILAFVPKTNLVVNCDREDSRWFTKFDGKPFYVRVNKTGQDENSQVILCSDRIIFADGKKENFKVGVEIGQDINMLVSPSTGLALNGARLIVNLSAECEYSGNLKNKEDAVLFQSKKCISAYCYANAGEGESTTDCVFSGHSIIAENGKLISQTQPFENCLMTADVDLDYIDYERNRQRMDEQSNGRDDYVLVGFKSDNGSVLLERTPEKSPFIINGEEELLLDIQAEGLKKRFAHTRANSLVIGLSGGLDSALAIIACVKAMDKMGLKRKNIIAVTMPCFGTTSRTFDNSVKLARALGVTLKKIDISKSVTRHLKDIEHDLVTTDAAYENAQARERTQVLMDLANSYNGLVVGTGDLSELALGWATYNGDHMSMYAVNASITKTLVRHLVEYYANSSKGKLKWVLDDILDTPVSPELIPSKEEIEQKTEDIVGPYILHDFFLYNIIRKGYTPKKLYFVACQTFKGEFDEKTVLKWLKTFYRRFFNQQFKRSCLPDGVRVSEISLSPRNSFVMPSDAVSEVWLKELENA